MGSQRWYQSWGPQGEEGAREVRGPCRAGCSLDSTAVPGLSLSAKPSQRPSRCQPRGWPDTLPLGTMDKSHSQGYGCQPLGPGNLCCKGPTGVGMGTSTPGGARASHTLWRLVCHCFSSCSSVLPCTCRDIASLLASKAADLNTLQHLRVCSCACKGGRGLDIHLPEILSSTSPPASTVFKLRRPPTSRMKMHRNVNLDPTQLWKTGCKQDLSLTHGCKRTPVENFT